MCILRSLVIFPEHPEVFSNSNKIIIKQTNSFNIHTLSITASCTYNSIQTNQLIGKSIWSQLFRISLCVKRNKIINICCQTYNFLMFRHC